MRLCHSVKCSGLRSSTDLVLPDGHHQGVLLGLAAAVRGDHVEVVDADVLLKREGEDLLGPRLEGGPVQVVNLHPRVPVHHPQAQVPGVAILEVLEGVCRDDDPGIFN